MAALLAIVTDANSYVKDNAAVDALLLKKGATFVCFHCGCAAAKLLRCGQCHHAHYCGPKVSPKA